MTAIRHLLKEASGFSLPHSWIGDLPYILFEYYDWRIIRTEELRQGDLVFRGKTTNTITHVGIAISNEKIYHCTSATGGSLIDLASTFIHKNNNSIHTPQQLRLHRDQRHYWQKQF